VTAETIDVWLDQLASAEPAPGGGAAAAMSAAMGAALVEMVCNLTIGKPKFAAHEATMTAALASATALRKQALQLADDDARAFAAVMSAYRLPKDTEDAQRERSARIQSALVEAADVPLRTAALAAEVIGLAESILDGANPNVLGDVAVAASTARSALESAEVNVVANLASMNDEGQRDLLATRLAAVAPAADRADAVVRAVRERVAP
jgi:formiminotetrahydrofolate cyclodeaminase